MNASNLLLSCDWGTSSFRLYLLDATNGAIITSQKAKHGTKAQYQAWLQAGSPPRLDYYLQFLQEQLATLAQESQQELSKLPLFISGMASSSIGMQELAYAKLPFSLDGKDLVMEQIEHPQRHKGPIYLLSGLASDKDVMRGEETQLLGLAPLLQAQNAIVIMPGTHSKHVYLNNRAITSFQSYMTGEFFALLSEQSILKASLEPARLDPEEAYFVKGVEAAQKFHLLTASFHTRTNELLHQTSKFENYHFLSGLLIGSEINDLPPEVPVYLCGGDHLQGPYQKALDIIQQNAYQIMNPELVESAVAAAHTAFYRRQNNQ